MKAHTKIIAAAAALLLAAAPSAARTIRDFFLSESGDVLNTLPATHRSDMLAYYDAGRAVTYPNNLGGSDSLILVTDNLISLSTSPVSDLQMAMLTTKRDTFILVVNTVRLPAPDSRLRAFDTDWNEIDADRIVKIPSMDDFVAIPKGSKTKKADITGQIRFPLIAYTVAPVTLALTARQSLKLFMSDDDWQAVEPYLADSISCPYRIKLVRK